MNEQKDRKTDRKTTQVIEEENKTVRVGYFPYANFQEGGYGEHKQGAGYEYIQKISYITGWKYEYVYGSFKECLDMLADKSHQKLIDKGDDAFCAVSGKNVVEKRTDPRRKAAADRSQHKGRKNTENISQVDAAFVNADGNREGKVVAHQA